MLLVLFASNARVQFQATVQGTLTDPKGAVLQCAIVTLIEPSTQAIKTTTSAEGFYRNDRRLWQQLRGHTATVHPHRQSEFWHCDLRSCRTGG
jgi:hypothetical protein